MAPLPRGMDWQAVLPRGPGLPPNGQLSGGAVLPSQFIAKHYSEALGRLPDPGGWQSSHEFFARNGCYFDSLKTWGRSVYLSPEFSSFPYDNAARLLAAYRGILNREPDGDGFFWLLSLLDKGYDWSAVVDSLYDSEEFQSLAPWICTPYSYSFGGYPAIWLPPGGSGFQGGTGRDLQEVIDRTPTGGTVFLAQKAVVLLDEPLNLSRRITLTTVGAPPHNHYALMGRLVRNSNFNEAAVKLRDGARLLNVWVDGARNYVGYRPGGLNVQLFGGNGTTVADSVISNTAGWSSLQAFGSAEGQPCASNTLARNLVTVYSSDHFDQTWADGLSVACENTLVQDNEIVDATDVPIVLFRSTPAVQRSQIRNNRLLSAGNSAYGALVADPLRSGQTHDFTGSVVENNTFWTGPNTWYVVGISVGTRAWFGTQSDMGYGARFVNNTTGSNYALVNTGIGVSGMLNATVQGNGGQLWVYPVARCPHVEVGASVSAGYASGNLQPYTDVLIQGCVGY